MYTVFIRELVTPKYYTVQVPDDDMALDSPTHPEQRLSSIPTPAYPDTFLRRLWYDPRMDYYGDSGDPRQRAELWEDTAGTATWEEILEAFPQLLGYYERSIRAVFADQLKAIVTPYLEQERETWHVQQREAEEWLADNSAPVQLIAALAAGRGIPLGTLVDKIMENVGLFRMAAGTILGEQQKTLDQLAAAASLADLIAIGEKIGVQHLRLDGQQ